VADTFAGARPSSAAGGSAAIPRSRLSHCARPSNPVSNSIGSETVLCKQLADADHRAAGSQQTLHKAVKSAGGSSCSSYAEFVLTKLSEPMEVWSGALSGSQTLPGSRVIVIGGRLQSAETAVILELK